MARCNTLITFLALCITVLGQYRHRPAEELYTRQTAKPNVLVIMTDDQGKSSMVASER